MALWQIMVGLGIGVIASIITVIVNSSRDLPSSSKTEYFLPPDGVCAICLCNVSNAGMRYLYCGHGFHENCVAELWANGHRNCPTCRHRI